MSDSVAYQGFLKRKCTFFSRWLDCSGEVLNGQLVIYKGNSSVVELRIDLDQYTKIEPSSDGGSTFIVEAEDGNVYEFDAGLPELADQWVSVMKKASSSDALITINDFNIISVLGRGHYGKVMLVQKEGKRKLYALKAVKKSHVAKSNHTQFVFTEKNILCSIYHPFIVKLSFSFESDTKYYIGMRYIPGGDLFGLIAKKRRLELSDVKIYAAEIFLALSYLHCKFIIYRDLKPENILLNLDGHIKIADFGLAKELGCHKNTSTFCGTPEYLAPEVVEHQSYSFPADWWSYGCVLYKMLTGSSPFTDENRNRLYKKIVEEEPEYPEDMNPDAKDLISKLLSKNAESRPTIEEIERHSFFSGIDFNRVYQRQYCPSYIPQGDPRADLSNFDPEFTMEVPIDSIASPCSFVDTQFGTFNYTGSLLSQSVGTPSYPPRFFPLFSS